MVPASQLPLPKRSLRRIALESLGLFAVPEVVDLCGRFIGYWPLSIGKDLFVGIALAVFHYFDSADLMSLSRIEQQPDRDEAHRA